MSSDYWFIVAAVVLIGLGGLFAAVDTAVSTVSNARVDDMVREGRSGARRLAIILDARATYVGLVVLLRVVCETAAAALIALSAAEWLGVGWGLVVAITAMTVISYVAMGVGPRTLGRQHAYTIALSMSYLLFALGILLKPVTRLLILIGNALTPGRGYRNGPFATEIELREVVDLAEARGVVAAGERRMIHSVFDLGDTSAREVMVPRPEMVWIEADKNVLQATNLATRSGHSRIPVIGENTDDVLGIVYLKDMVERTVAKRTDPTTLRVSEIMRDAEFIPDSKPLDKVLADMQLTRNHMAILVDEYGGIAGLVTIEDVLEEIVGEITDEYDIDELAPVEDLGDGSYRVSARLPVEDLGELFDVEIEEEEVETVGGLVALELGRVPLPGARVKSHGLQLVAEGGPNRKGRQRIITVLVTRVPGEGADGPDPQRHESSGGRGHSGRSGRHDRTAAREHEDESHRSTHEQTTARMNQ
ncbi:hemolysin family protein [Gordonia sp. GONU]|uniref:hemolysin family protein n=1 Tax=Gordonia TaxID=2053 RepID=UPI00041B8CEF|nr:MULTISPECIES: hemolysin family protein [Gordonia]MCR8896540.1 hemolysin family protein [Gordonia sp. GONU]MCZ4650403.1 hemolysin family protein [Gordonia amicalis]